MKQVIFFLCIFSFSFGQTRFYQTCLASLNCELVLFQEISRLYRPSKEEGAVVKYIVALANEAQNQIWKEKLFIATDVTGNVVIRIPATGKYKGSKVKSVALQAHMDMVLAYAGAKPGEDIRKYFVNGVNLEVVNGWLQSKGRRTTLGADNGVGIAYALRYLIDPSLVHPPLELIFTVQEEVGLKGALNLKIPIQSERLISLDGMPPSPDTIITSSQGSFGIHLKSPTVKGVPTPTDLNYYKVTLTGLLGGHSGNDIYKKRMNALKGLAESYASLKSEVRGLRLISMLAGDTNVLNKIPNLYTVLYGVDKSVTLAMFETVYKKNLLAQLGRLPDENKNVNLSFASVDKNEVPPIVPEPKLSDSVIASIINAPNGIIEADPKYPAGAKSSSNLSYISFGFDPKASSLNWAFGFFSRSFITASLNAISARVQGIVTEPVLSYGKPQSVIQSSYPPWNALPQSSIQKYVLKTHSKYFSKTTAFPAGIEPSVFQQIYPRLDILVIGPLILEAHTVNERLELKSFSTVAMALKEILAGIQ